MSLTVDLRITLPDGSTAAVTGTIDEEPAQQGLTTEAMATWLGMIDAAELEAVALETQSTGDGSYTAVILSLLQRWARGTP